MLRPVAVSTQGHKVRECIVTLLAPSDLVMNLKVFQRPALPLVRPHVQRLPRRLKNCLARVYQTQRGSRPVLGGQPKDFIPFRLQKLANLHGPLFLVLNL